MMHAWRRWLKALGFGPRPDVSRMRADERQLGEANARLRCALKEAADRDADAVAALEAVAREWSDDRPAAHDR